MDYFIEPLNEDLDKNKVSKLLNDLNLSFEEELDYTLVARKGQEIIGTCSKYKNIMKCFGVKEEYRGQGISSELINSLIDKVLGEGYKHYFIFTKEKNVDIFKEFGAKELYRAEGVSLLEGGIYSIENYLKDLIKELALDLNKKRGAIVMNCNPFTLGHRYIIEYASKNCNELIVFILEEDKSFFPFEDRLNLVKKSVQDLENVKVISGGEYIISEATFPSYFIKEENERLKAYTKIDSGLFGKYIAKALNINKRFVGEEPFCEVTKTYNDSLKEELKKFNIKLEIIKRREYNGEVISASKVRELLKVKEFNLIKEIVPEETFKYLIKKYK